MWRRRRRVYPPRPHLYSHPTDDLPHGGNPSSPLAPGHVNLCKSSLHPADTIAAASAARERAIISNFLLPRAPPTRARLARPSGNAMHDDSGHVLPRLCRVVQSGVDSGVGTQTHSDVTPQTRRLDTGRGSVGPGRQSRKPQRQPGKLEAPSLARYRDRPRPHPTARTV